MKKHPYNYKNLSGKQIQNWLVIEDTGKRNRNDPVWKCKCLKCNCEYEVSGNSLRNGSSQCKFCFYKTAPGRPKILSEECEVKSQIFARYKCDAKRRAISFNLAKEEFLSFLDKECFYCGKKHQSYQNSKNEVIVKYNGIDRVDNTKGYTIQNCVTSCKSCNSKKKSITPDMIKKAYYFLFVRSE